MIAAEPTAFIDRLRYRLFSEEAFVFQLLLDLKPRAELLPGTVRMEMEHNTVKTPVRAHNIFRLETEPVWKMTQTH